MYIILLYYTQRLFSGFCERVWERRTCHIHDARIVAEQRRVCSTTYQYTIWVRLEIGRYKYVIWDPTTREVTVIGIISNRKVYRNAYCPS